MNDFEEYFKAGEPGRRERAEAWATAIGLQQVDGLVPSQFLFNTAIEHIEGRITQNQARRRIRDYYAAQGETTERDPDKEEADKVSERIVAVIKDDKRKIRELSEGARKEGCQNAKSGKKKAVRKSGKKTVDKLWELLKDQPHLTLAGMVAALGITRSTIQKHLARFKASGRLRRVGPDKGGHWEVVE